VTVCLKEEVAESLMEDLVKADLARLLQVLDHHGSHARIRQYDLLAGSAQYRFRIKLLAILLRFVCLLLAVDTFTTVLKDNKSLRSRETVEIKVFSIFLLADGRIQELDPDPGGPKTY
jgi:hypothetical protein